MQWPRDANGIWFYESVYIKCPKFGLVQAEWENGEQADDLNMSTQCATNQSCNMKPNVAPRERLEWRIHGGGHRWSPASNPTHS